MHFTTQLQGDVRVASLHNCNAYTTLSIKRSRPPAVLYLKAPSRDGTCLGKGGSKRPKAKPLS